jgi:hypothetical protein
VNLSIPAYQLHEGFNKWDWEFLTCAIMLMLLGLVNFNPQMLLPFLGWVTMVCICMLSLNLCERHQDIFREFYYWVMDAQGEANANP